MSGAARDRVELRETTEADLEAFFQHQRDPEGRWMAAFTSKDGEDRDAFFAHWRRILGDPTILRRTVWVDGRIAGHVVSFVRGGQREVSYWYGREYWGRGLATRALRSCLEQWTERPLFARVAKDNAGSLRVLRRCGFEISGESRGFAEARGRQTEEFLLTLSSSTEG